MSESPKANRNAIKCVVSVQHGRFCLRLTKCFHNGKLSAVASLKAVSLTLEFIVSESPKWVCKPPLPDKGKDFLPSEDHRLTVSPSFLLLPVQTRRLKKLITRKKKVCFFLTSFNAWKVILCETFPTASSTLSCRIHIQHKHRAEGRNPQEGEGVFIW